MEKVDNLKSDEKRNRNKVSKDDVRKKKDLREYKHPCASSFEEL